MSLTNNFSSHADEQIQQLAGDLAANLNWQLKPFNALTTREYHDILQLRSAVFVVEQQCVYQDIDGLDTEALHLWASLGDETVVAYARIFGLSAEQGVMKIGRVVVTAKHRDKKLGVAVMQRAIALCQQHRPGVDITLAAQAYLQGWYEKLGFVAEGAIYKEDNLPHIDMRRVFLQK